jgi:hypothetical protein
MPPTKYFVLAGDEAGGGGRCVEKNEYFLAHIELLLEWRIVQMEALKYNVPTLFYKF